MPHEKEPSDNAGSKSVAGGHGTAKGARHNRPEGGGGYRPVVSCGEAAETHEGCSRARLGQTFSAAMIAL